MAKKTPVVPKGAEVQVWTTPPNTPAFTWDIQTPPPTVERRDGDEPYPAVKVHNSLSPVTKMGRLIRPLTDIDAEFAVWEVDVEGTTRVVRSPMEAWN